MKHPLLAGIGSIINVAGNYHTFPEYTSKKANDTAIASVWKKVGSYLFDAIGEVDKQLKIK
ncbi:MAG: hypothetical protein LBM62_02580 [Mediterranea sp.]|nr:hypothetical protein [Mediterranea sp.]